MPIVSLFGRVIALDLRGHGESESTEGVYTMGMHAEDCMALLNACDAREPVILCGLSMGGYVAFEFVRRHPGRVAGLVLAATRASSDSEQTKAQREASRELLRREGVVAVVEELLPRLVSERTRNRNPKTVERLRRMMKKTSRQAIAGLEGMKHRVDMRSSLAGIHVPTLILHGREDALIPLAEAESIRLRISGSVMEIYDNAGHLLNVEQPNRFNESVSAFLQRL